MAFRIPRGSSRTSLSIVDKPGKAAMAVFCQCGRPFSAEGTMTVHELSALPGKGVPDLYIPLPSPMSEGKPVLWLEGFFGGVPVLGSRAAEPPSSSALEAGSGNADNRLS